MVAQARARDVALPQSPEQVSALLKSCFVGAWRETSSLATRARWINSGAELAHSLLPHSNAVQASISQLEPPYSWQERHRLILTPALGGLYRRVCAKRVFPGVPPIFLWGTRSVKHLGAPSEDFKDCTSSLFWCRVPDIGRS